MNVKIYCAISDVYMYVAPFVHTLGIVGLGIRWVAFTWLRRDKVTRLSKNTHQTLSCGAEKVPLPAYLSLVFRLRSKLGAE